MVGDNNNFWPQHPLFDVGDQQTAAKRLNLFDDGLIFIDSDLTIISVNIEASSILELSADCVVGRSLSVLCSDVIAWPGLEAAVKQGSNSELALHSAKGKSILATVRKASPLQKNKTSATLVILRDLEVFEYRRRKAVGADVQPAFRTLADNKARPDFNTQRRISPALEKVLARGERAVLQGARILITGESGVGKTEIARYFHTFVANATDSFQVVNCASIPESLFESEMFGYEKGAFTGALQSGRPGFIEQAEGGTLFLDEIGEIPLSVQAKLLSFLEEGVIRRVGSGKQRVANVRVIAATNRDLRTLVSAGEFRADLFYRLAVVHLPIPALRSMPELIQHLIERFVDTVNQRRRQKFVVPDWVRSRFVTYAWPGNVRELLNVIQQLSIFYDEGADIDEILSDLLQPIVIPGSNAYASSDQVQEHLEVLLTQIIQQHNGEINLKDEVRRIEKILIDKAIQLHGSKRKAALALGVDIGTVVRKTTGPSIN